MLIAIFVILLALCLFFFLYLLFRPNSWDGVMLISQDDTGKRIFSLEIDKEPDDIRTSNFVVFKVVDLTKEESSAQ